MPSWKDHEMVCEVLFLNRVCLYVCVLHCACIEVRRQLAGVKSTLCSENQTQAVRFAWQLLFLLIQVLILSSALGTQRRDLRRAEVCKEKLWFFFRHWIRSQEALKQADRGRTIVDLQVKSESVSEQIDRNEGKWAKAKLFWRQTS